MPEREELLKEVVTREAATTAAAERKRLEDAVAGPPASTVLSEHADLPNEAFASDCPNAGFSN